MTQIADELNPTSPIIASGGRRTMLSLLVLAAVLLFGAVVVVQLRQPWAMSEVWPWFVFLAVMFVAAFALRRLEPWLPGELIPARLAAFPPKRRRRIGAFCILGALALTGLIVVILWPNYRAWHGTLELWLAGLVLVIAGGWLIGAVGDASPRAATAIMLWRDTRRNRWFEIAAFLLILLLAIFVRTYRIESLPPGIYVDETNGGLDALQMLEGSDVSPFATGWYEEPNGFLYYMAALFKLFGANWISLKLVSLIPSILAIPAIYLLGRLLFGRTAGLFAMFLLAVSRWHMSLSRWGWAITPPPFLQMMAFFFLIRGLRDRRALDYALGGIMLSLSVYTYLSSRLAVATLLLYVGYWFISDPAGLRVSLRRSLLGVIIFGCAALVTVAPLLVTYISDPFILNNRVDEISIFRDVSVQGTTAPLVANITDILKFFHQVGDHQGKHNLPNEPMADPTTGLLFGIGLAYTVFSLRDHRRLLLVMWMVIGLAGSFLSSNHESPQSFRSLTALPAVILMAADVLDRIIRAAYRFLKERGFSARMPALPTLAAGGLAVGVLATAGLWETGVYFGPQAESIAVIQGFNPIENAVAHETMDALEVEKTVYLSPNFSDFSPMRFLVYGLIKAKTGENTLINRPYSVVLPEVNFPLPDDGHDAIIMLDRDYWLLRDYIASFYPDADMEMMTLVSGEPTFMRIDLTQEQIAALQGLTQRITYEDGREEEQVVSEVALEQPDAQIASVTWEGAIRLEHGGEYELGVGSGLQVYIDGQLWDGTVYLGRGLYGLRVVWERGAEDSARLLWRLPAQTDAVPVPREALFRVTWPQQGLLGRYYRNINWEGDPVFTQVTPFLLLAWPDESPLVPNGEFSATYTGALRITEAGSYLFHVEADDGVRLILDGNVLGEGLIPNQPNGFDVTVELAEGDHPIQIDYFQGGGGSALRVYWRLGEGNWTPIPPEAFIPEQP